MPCPNPSQNCKTINILSISIGEMTDDKLSRNWYNEVCKLNYLKVKVSQPIFPASLPYKLKKDSHNQIEWYMYLCIDRGMNTFLKSECFILLYSRLNWEKSWRHPGLLSRWGVRYSLRCFLRSSNFASRSGQLSTETCFCVKFSQISPWSLPICSRGFTCKEQIFVT